jgi:pimeloyl-ACP methyl ester carboxylesterase
LIIHGKSDGLIPAGNGELIARQIPRAKLVMLDRASHMFLTDQCGAALEEILKFLSSPDHLEVAPRTERSATPV